MNRFIKVLLIFLCPGIRLHTVHGVNYDPVVIDLPNLIEVAQVVKAYLAVQWKEKLAHFTCNAHVNITQAAIHMDEHNIVVKDKQIHN